MSFHSGSFAIPGLLGLLLASPTWAASQGAGDRIFVLSGGGAPYGNHYSQYLQTRLLTDQLRTILDADRVDVRFGAGNNSAAPIEINDVHRTIVKDDGKTYHVQLPGVIERNGPATKESVQEFFAQSAGERITVDDTFFLFVTDHGMPNKDDPNFENNCIDLWGFDKDTLSTRPFAEHCLSVTELQDLIKTNVPARRTVFVMTQCFSGGFHKMSVTMEGGYPTADASLCGFTAVTPDTTASGCTPDVDGPGYKGYERYLAQQLTGFDVVTGQPMPYPRKATVREAHIGAALEDTAKDIPFSTSDFYLTQWAKTIEGGTVAPRTNVLSRDEMVELFREALDATNAAHPSVGRAGALRSSVIERQSYLAGTISLLTAYDPEVAPVVNKPVADIEAYLASISAERIRLEEEATALDDETANVWFDYGFIPWNAAVVAGNVTNLTSEQRDVFELGFMSDLEKTRRSAQRGAISRLAVWSATDPAKAEALSYYMTHRGSLRYEWLAANSSADALAQLERLNALEDESDAKWTKASKLEERYDQLRRIIFTRKQIAAAITLGAARDQRAIDEVSGLRACEAAPFRSGK